MHKNGYTFFNIGLLTYMEINNLIDAWNREQITKERSAKKASTNKGKRGRK